jgi:hypothetical protein
MSHLGELQSQKVSSHLLSMHLKAFLHCKQNRLPWVDTSGVVQDLKEAGIFQWENKAVVL